MQSISQDRVALTRGSRPRRAVPVNPGHSPSGSDMKGVFLQAEIQGRAWGVLVETGAGLEHLESARKIDALGDAVMDHVVDMLDEARDALVAGNATRVAGLIHAIKAGIQTYKSLDRAEQEHWDRQAPPRVANARDEGLEISRLCERGLANTYGR